MLGYSEQELLERNIEDITYPEDVEKSVKLSKQTLRGKIPLFSIEKRYVKKTGEILWSILRLRPFAMKKKMCSTPWYG